MISKTTFSTFIWLFLLQVLFERKLANGMLITTSTNATSVQVGQPFSMSCEVTDLTTLGSEELKIFFYYKLNGQFASYTVPASTSSNRQANFELLLNDGDRPYIAQVQALGHTFPTYEISILPNSVFTTDFNCYWSYNGTSSFNSNNVLVQVTDGLPPTPAPSGLPQIVLTSNASTVYLDEPFTVSCTVFHFSPAGKKYLVNYYNSRNGLLAGYEIDETGKSLLSAGEFDSVSTRFGSRSTFPTFDLVITERLDRTQTYWCELVADIDLNKKYPSPHWNLTGPFVDFTSTGRGSTQQTGKCTISKLARYSELEYQVLFYSDLGPRSGDNLLGFFWLRANKVMEFAYEHLTPWASIAHGPGVSYPNFEIEAKLNRSASANYRWWCVLNIGVPGQLPTKRPIKSNFRLL